MEQVARMNVPCSKKRRTQAEDENEQSEQDIPPGWHLMRIAYARHLRRGCTLYNTYRHIATSLLHTDAV